MIFNSILDVNSKYINANVPHKYLELIKSKYVASRRWNLIITDNLWVVHKVFLTLFSRMSLNLNLESVFSYFISAQIWQARVFD